MASLGARPMRAHSREKKFPMRIAPVGQRAVALALDGGIRRCDLRIRHNGHARDSGDERGRIQMVDHDLDIANRGKRVAIHGHRPQQTRARPLLAAPDEGEQRLRELGRIAIGIHPHPAGRQRYAELGESGQKCFDGR